MNKSYAFPAIIALASLSTALGAQPVEGPADPAPAAPAAPVQAQPAAPAAGAATQLVDREFASYDLDKSGGLSSTEFATWVAKLRKPAANGTPQQDGAQFSASLFARADTDHNQQVSKTEMTTLLVSAQG